MRRIFVRIQARREIREAYDWYEQERSGLDAEFEQALDAIFNNLAEFPQAHPVVFGSTRRIVMLRFPYMIFYRQRRDGVISITGCIHGRRNPSYWRSRV
jgi:toxin ParE1/3/4